MGDSVKITDQRFAVELEHKRFRAALSDAGAIVSFAGIVRAEDGVTELHLNHYPGFTETEINNIVATAKQRWPLLGCKVIHRVGKLEPEEVIVWVATASAHRRDAFEAADFLMDYLKSEAPFWKQEKRGQQSEWIEPRAQDISDKKRWTD